MVAEDDSSRLNGPSQKRSDRGLTVDDCVFTCSTLPCWLKPAEPHLSLRLLRHLPSQMEALFGPMLMTKDGEKPTAEVLGRRHGVRKIPARWFSRQLGGV